MSTLINPLEELSFVKRAPEQYDNLKIASKHPDVPETLVAQANGLIMAFDTRTISASYFFHCSVALLCKARIAVEASSKEVKKLEAVQENDTIRHAIARMNILKKCLSEDKDRKYVDNARALMGMFSRHLKGMKPVANPRCEEEMVISPGQFLSHTWEIAFTWAGPEGVGIHQPEESGDASSGERKRQAA